MQCINSIFSENAFGDADLWHRLAQFLRPQTLFGCSSADWRMESMVRKSTPPLRGAMGEFVVM